MQAIALKELIDKMDYHSTIALKNRLTQTNTIVSFNGLMYSVSVASCLIVMFDDYEVINDERINLYINHNFIGIINPYHLTNTN